MGAGRKTQTFASKEKSDPYWTVNCSVTARNLRKSDLSGVIFGCKHNTMKECFSKLLFGLPAPHFAYVRNIDPGLPLFLFNYSDRRLHGVFEAASSGQMNIDPYGWTADGSEYTSYAAQVRFRIQMQCQPLLEEQFKSIIAENYYEPRLFWFELDQDQTRELISLFSKTAVTANTSFVQTTLSSSSPFRGLPTPNTSHVGDNVAHTDWSNMECGFFWDAPGLDAECQPLEAPINDEAAKKYEQELGSQNQHFMHSYSSAVRNTGTNLPQKKWSALFKTSPTSDIKKQDEGFDKLVSEVNFPYSGESNMEWESCCVAPCLDGENQLLETHADKEGVERYGELGSWEPNCDVPCLPIVTEPSTSLLVSGSMKSFLTADTDQDGEDFKTVVSEVNLPHPDEFDMALGSSCVELFLEGRRQPSETCTEDTTDISEEEHVRLKLNCGCLNSSTVIKGVNLDDHNDDPDSPFVTKVWWEDKSFSETAAVSEMMTSSDLQSVITKLIKITEELKASQLAQIQRISFLEHELVESKREIQQLKHQHKMLESGSFPSRQVERAESELIIESHAKLHESILIVGGFDGFSWLSALDLYSPSWDLMKSLRPMNFVRSYSSAAKLNGELYVLGGVDDDIWYDTVESYNPRSNQWASCPSLNQKKGSLAGISLNNRIFAIGGGNGVECFSVVEMLDPNIGSWIFTRSMFHKRFAPAAAEINGILYVVGGYDGKDYLKSVERFDPREHSWTRIASMSTRRGCHSLVVLNDKLYALGGYDGARMVPTVEVLDPRIGSWMMGESMNDSRGYSGAVTIGDSIYVIGGVKDDDEILDTVECYKESQGWQITDLKAVGKRCFFSAIVL